MRKLIGNLVLIYDEKGRRIKSIYTGEDTGLVDEYEYEYDDMNNVIRETSKMGNNKYDHEIIYTYNDKGQKISSVHSNGSALKFKYNEHGDCILTEGGKFKTENEYEYDDNGRVVKITSSSFMTSHDENGNSTFVKFADRETKYEYDSNNNVVLMNNKFMNSNGVVIGYDNNVYKYNEHGDCILIESVESKDKMEYEVESKDEMEYEYDDNGRVVKITSFTSSYDE